MRAVDRQAIAARGQRNAELLLDARQMAVVLAEQERQQAVVVEIDVDRGAMPRRAVTAGAHASSLAHSRAAATTSVPASEFGPAPTMRVSTMRPIGWPPASPGVKWTACRYGERPTYWPARRPAFSSSAGMTRPTHAALNSFCCSRSRVCSACKRVSFSASGTWPSIKLAGVPGRGLYLNEK